jgi:hypothetical protein
MQKRKLGRSNVEVFSPWARPMPRSTAARRREVISGRVDLDRGALSSGLISEPCPSFPKAIGIESPQPAPGALPSQQGQLTC